MNKKQEYHKPQVIEVSKTKSSQSIQLAGVRATQAIILKKELTQK